MTVTTSSPAGEALAPREDLVSLTIDGFEVAVPKGTLVIRAAELLGIQVPRFCDHPLLDPVGACRQCLVEVVDDGNGRGMPKPQASCTIPVTPGMVVKTQITSPVADKAQQGIMEFLLINHPLDCPICDKGGECPLQNQAMSNGRSETRFVDVKRTFPKPINISAQVLLDRERCVLCARCTRFSAQVAGDPFIELLERGALQQVGIYTDQPFESYFSGNTVQICPVGALTSAKYRFRARPFDLVSTPTVCEHCSSGCALRADHRRGAVMRRQAGDDPEVNEEWNCDKGRWAFQYSAQPDRLTQPLVRDADGVLQPTSWSDALDVVARGLIGARGRAGVLVGGRLPLEDAYAYAKFARTVLETNDIDFRARTHSAEEADFLAARVAGTGLGVTYRDLEHAHTVLLAGLEPEEEVGIVLLRLRKAARRGRTAVFGIAALASPGLAKAHGTLLPTVPGDEAAVLDALGGTGAAALGAAAEAAAAGLRRPGAVILVGERLGTLRGGLSAAVRLAETTGARLAWLPRRAGERAAIEAGAMPGLLPGGRSVHDATARAHVEARWGSAVPEAAGRDTTGILAAAAAGELDALVVGGVEIDDLPDPASARAALATVAFLVSLEIRPSGVTDLAHVVLPVAAHAEKAGTFVNWEGRHRSYGPVLELATVMSDARVLHQVADAMDLPLALPDIDAARHELRALGRWKGPRPSAPDVPVGPARERTAAPGSLVLASWRMLLDDGRLSDGEPFLAATARLPVARLSAATAASCSATDGDQLTVSSDRGSITLPLLVTEMCDGVVWLPGNSAGSTLRRSLVAEPGDLVRVHSGVTT